MRLGGLIYVGPPLASKNCHPSCPKQNEKNMTRPIFVRLGKIIHMSSILALLFAQILEWSLQEDG